MKKPVISHHHRDETLTITVVGLKDYPEPKWEQYKPYLKVYEKSFWEWVERVSKRNRFSDAYAFRHKK